MIFLKNENGNITYPYSVYNLIKDNPNTSFPTIGSLIQNKSLLEEFGVYEVYDSFFPDYDKFTQKLVESEPSYQNGKWFKSWKVESLTELEINEIIQLEKFSVLRKRNELLVKSDWTQMPDVPLANKSEWAVYRQSLRDITLQEGYPLNVTWPSEPV